jgi:hypothetical protein
LTCCRPNLLFVSLAVYEGVNFQLSSLHTVTCKNAGMECVSSCKPCGREAKARLAICLHMRPLIRAYTVMSSIWRALDESDSLKSANLDKITVRPVTTARFDRGLFTSVLLHGVKQDGLRSRSNGLKVSSARLTVTILRLSGKHQQSPLGCGVGVADQVSSAGAIERDGLASDGIRAAQSTKR